MLIRINKYLAEAGIGSRRNVDELIKSQRIFVNGKLGNIGQIIDSEKDKVTIDGEEVKKAQTVYYALNKPINVVSTTSDEFGRKTVIELVPRTPAVYPVGRLDADSEGLIVLTNDGELADKLTHPKYVHEKEYVVRASKDRPPFPSIAEIKTNFERGLKIDNHIMKADKIFSIQDDGKGNISFRVILHTGYNRQIRRMCSKMKLTVTKLIRVRIGRLSLEQLKLESGEYKTLERGLIL